MDRDTCLQIALILQKHLDPEDRSRMASLMQDPKGLTDVLLKYPEANKEVNALLASKASGQGPSKAPSPAKHVDPYANSSFAQEVEKIKAQRMHEVHACLELKKAQFKDIAMSFPPGMQETITGVDKVSFANCQFVTKLWRLLSTLALAFPNDAFMGSTVLLLEGTVTGNPDYWPYVLREYYETLQPVFGDVKRVLGELDQGLERARMGEIDASQIRIEYEFLEKLKDHPIFGKIDAATKLKSKTLSNVGRQKVFKVLHELNCLATIDHYIDSNLFCTLQKQGNNIVQERGAGAFNQLFAQGAQSPECLSIGMDIMRNVDFAAIQKLVQDKPKWAAVSEAVREVCKTIPEMSEFGGFISALDQIILNGPKQI